MYKEYRNYEGGADMETRFHVFFLLCLILSMSGSSGCGE